MHCPFNNKNCKKRNQKIFLDLGKLPRVDILLSKKDLKALTLEENKKLPK